ncbi:alpha/beta hydrolase family esterase [Actinoplanes sp. NPDC051513]|uniref:extracellular catalytic domain type 1 short-chain-length polyhydroxyalkanoate depolymerase n=1 Tax=Actinoplanes sp. NPDC051513 TaxID=3363908 RepID=UPI0037920C75
MRRLALAIPLLLLAACATWSGPPPAPAPSAIAYGSSEHALRVGGLDRTFRIYRPETSMGVSRIPLVLMLHGGFGSARQAEQSYGWNAIADRDGFLVAYPDGVGRTWNVSPDCCGAAGADQVDDVGFIDALVATVAQEAPVDLARVYATGISNGAMLAYRLACDTTLFAAIAPVAGTMLGPCPDAQPISILHIHGTADRIIPYGGGRGRLPVESDIPSILELIADWRRIDSCPRPRFSTSGVVTTTTAICPGSRLVVLKAVGGAGHQWPGATGPGPIASRVLGLDPPSDALDATAAIAGFFRLS